MLKLYKKNMIVKKEDALRLCNLAKLEFSDKELEDILISINKITDHFEVLNSIDTTGKNPLTYLNNSTNQMRDDDVIKFDDLKITALDIAPDKNSDYFRIKKFLK